MWQERIWLGLNDRYEAAANSPAFDHSKAGLFKFL
jgi:hypothetical protein